MAILIFYIYFVFFIYHYKMIIFLFYIIFRDLNFLKKLNKNDYTVTTNGHIWLLSTIFNKILHLDLLRFFTLKINMPLKL